MIVTPIKTKKVIPGQDTDILAILDEALPKLQEGSVVAVTSKIVAICEGRYADPAQVEKDELIMQEADYYLPRSSSKYNVMMTIKGGGIAFSSGIDESNGNGYYILWPSSPQQSANEMREYLASKHNLKNIGIIITDTTSVPMRWGQRGVFALAHSGFAALNPYIGEKDLFGREYKMTSSAVADALSTAAVLVMGEGNEQTPLAGITDVPFVTFQQRNPTEQELKELEMPLEDDLFEPLLTAVKWRKGKSAKIT